MNFFNSKFASKKKQSNSPSANSLALEVLEDRVLLSTVSIFAAGETGEEAFELKVNDEVVATFDSVGGDASAREFVQYNYVTDADLTADDIRVEYINDLYDPDKGIDRNLVVDKIIVDGVTFQTESPSVYSTGVFRDGAVTGPGLLETERLNINGSFFFNSDGATESGTRIRVDARGAEGGEIIALEVDGNEVTRYTLTDTTETYLFEVDENVSVSDVRIRFVNDLYDPDKGIDRNVIVNNVQTIDLDNGFREVVRLATNPRVFSTGTFTEADGIVSGLGRGNTLHTNGLFTFSTPDNSTSDNPSFNVTNNPAVATTDETFGTGVVNEAPETEDPGLVRVDLDELASGL